MRRGLAVFAFVMLVSSVLLAEALHLEKTISLPPDIAVRYTAISPAGNLVAAVCRASCSRAGRTFASFSRDRQSA